MTNENHRNIFVCLCIVAFNVEITRFQSMGVVFTRAIMMAVGSSVITIPASILIGLLCVWLLSKVYLAFHNPRHPDKAKTAIQMPLFQRLNYGLIFGYLTLFTSCASPLRGEGRE